MCTTLFLLPIVIEEMPLSNLLAVRVSPETSFLQGDGECEEEMFSMAAASEASEANAATLSAANSSFKAIKAALLACQAQYAFQRNWFPDPIAGLFSYQSWNGMDGFWQDGVAIETLANTMHYGNHSRYFSVLQVSQQPIHLV